MDTRTSADYRGILKDVLRNQIQVLINQLCDQLGIESVLLLSENGGNPGLKLRIDQLCDQVGIESVLLLSENGSDIQVGSERGKQFLVEKGDIEAQFLTFCSHGTFENSSSDRDTHVHATSKRVREPNKRLSGYQIKAESAGNRDEELTTPPVLLGKDVGAAESPKDVRTCELCGYTTKYSHNLKRHLQSRHWVGNTGSNNTLMKCSECEYVSRFKANMQRHQRTKHSLIMSDGTWEYIKIIMPPEDHLGKNHACETNIETNEDTAVSLDGIIDHDNNSNDRCLKTETGSLEQEEIQDGVVVLPKCSYDIKIVGSSAMKSKKRKKSGFECNYCHEFLDDLDELKVHIDEVHFGGHCNEFICNTCGKEFKKELNYRGHIASHVSSGKCT